MEDIIDLNEGIEEAVKNCYCLEQKTSIEFKEKIETIKLLEFVVEVNQDAMEFQQKS